jgi:hypothetical protein
LPTSSNPEATQADDYSRRGNLAPGNLSVSASFGSHEGGAMLPAKEVSIVDLSNLAMSRGYALVMRADGCTLFSLRTRLPEPNEWSGGLLFGKDEAWEFLTARSRSHFG